jgi:endoglucanase
MKRIKFALATILIVMLAVACSSDKENDNDTDNGINLVATEQTSRETETEVEPETEIEQEPEIIDEPTPQLPIIMAGGDNVGELTSMELVHKMTAGWNLGNTLDAHWNARAWGEINEPREQEVLWGNPVTTKAMIDAIREAGFNTVRIPVTWYIFTGEAPDYIIDERWMDRVQEVVDYVIDNGMFAILNIHHDDYMTGGGENIFVGARWELGWLRTWHVDENRAMNDEEKAEMLHRMGRLWEQIADRFKDYDEHLIFEGINEPRAVGIERITNEMWEEMSLFMNEILQVFVDTVRNSGGNNFDRHLMVTPYFASVGMDANDREGRIRHFVDIDREAGTGKLRVTDPREATAECRLIVSLHYYEPWGFVTAPHDSQWHSWYFDLEVGSVIHNINNVMRIFKENFIDYGIPVIMGETGAVRRTMPDGESNEAERVKWAEHYVGGLKEIGVPTVIWDDGGSFRLFDRRNLTWFYPDLMKALVEAGQREVQ